MSNGDKHAVVLSGGGADGAYEVGVLKALFSGKAASTGQVPLDPDIFTGTSIGSLNAAFLVSRWQQHGVASIGDLERVWIERLAEGAQSCGNGGLRFRANPLDLLNPRCYLPNPFRPWLLLAQDGFDLSWNGLQRLVHLWRSDDPLIERVLAMFDLSSFVEREPLEQTVREEIQFENIRRSDKQLIVAAANWQTGELELFRNLNMTDKLGPLAILASSAIPGFFPPTVVGAIPYVDGGVVMNTPLRPAISAGANVLHVIYMDPEVKNLPLEDINYTVQMMYRMQIITWARTINREIAHDRVINQAVRVLSQIDPKVAAEIADYLTKTQPTSKIATRLQRPPEQREIIIHRYHPSEDLGGVIGFLNLQQARIEALIEKGFSDGVYHDCVASRCVLPYLSGPPGTEED
jgi:predicted acylesterase/phospholipase RssA